MRISFHAVFLALVSVASLAACKPRPDDGGVDLRRPVKNDIANIPPQCFTRTRDADGSVHNPCYVCHAEADEPNYRSQPENQLSYAFPMLRAAAKVRNDWKNLFVDRRPAIDATADHDVLAYVRTDNYRRDDGGVDVAGRLAELPRAWDVNGNGRWDGYTPDATFRFDGRGYDRRADGSTTAWRAFAYLPFPGAFMPTNGSFDDVLIRLPPAFRERSDGHEDIAVYEINLAIVEALVRRRNVAIEPVDERTLGADLDADGKLDTASRVVYDWAPLEKREMHYVGRARAEQDAGRVHVAAGLFPEGTEFLHSVRYLDIAADGSITPAARMKELRYARKLRWQSYSDLRQTALIEGKEAALSPDRPEQYFGDAERGITSKLGWVYQGFIEDRHGRLRPQTREESQFCVGCHGGLSATDDGIFSFSRKLGAGATYGWYHWGDHAFHGLPDPLRIDGKPEFASYLLDNHAGDEYRANDEVRARFFATDGQPRAAAFAQLKTDLSILMLPSAARALALDKAYLAIVREQSFVRGRDAVLSPAENVWPAIEQDTATGIVIPLPAPRLASDWQSKGIPAVLGDLPHGPASP
ncbi:hypothetical protein [Solimonas terrae]|uniref:hypothetical protein n=1 Tax=Solimonas terrae TaxID=1396819 RepID=UPI001583C014|nr:hypothetical protein [Solimonas terrae]